jgi:quinol monooxygenase YgiN
MTILIMGTVKLSPGEGVKAAQLLSEHVKRVLQEEGCEEYSVAFDAADPDLIRIAERWASADALAAHEKADHQKTFGRALRAHAPQGMKVDVWDGQYLRNLIGG